MDIVMENHYLGKFDENGKAESFLLEGIHYKTAEEKAAKIAEGYVELTQDEWEYYTNNKGMGDNGTGYLRDPSTGKPVSAPKTTYTVEQLSEMAYSFVNSKNSEIDNQIVLAQAEGDTDYVNELKDLKTAYATKYQSILTDIQSGKITEPSQISYADVEGSDSDTTAEE